MLIKDKDILVDDGTKGKEEAAQAKPRHPKISRENMRAAWGDAFDYYIRGITEKYLRFRGRASRLEFWGFACAGGIVLIPIYLLGDFADMPMLFYYFILATFIPSLAVAARRLHDINKNAALYLGSGAAISGGLLFVNVAAAALAFFVWAAVLIRLFSKETDISEGFYGPAGESDEVFGEDSLRIIKKFRFIAIVLALVWCAVTGAKFDDWSRQAQQTALRSEIDEKIQKLGEESGMKPAEIKAVREQMRGVLNAMSGKAVTEEDLNAEITKLIKAGKSQ